MDIRVKKAQNMLCACRRAYDVAWSLGSSVVHWLYVAIFRPAFIFASFVWWPGCQTASARKKLSKTQRLASLEITGAMRTTSTNVAEALICLPTGVGGTD